MAQDSTNLSCVNIWLKGLFHIIGKVEYDYNGYLKNSNSNIVNENYNISKIQYYSRLELEKSVGKTISNSFNTVLSSPLDTVKPSPLDTVKPERLEEENIIYKVYILIEDNYNEDIFEFYVFLDKILNTVKFYYISKEEINHFSITSRYYGDTIEICSILPLLFKNINELKIHIDEDYEWKTINNRLIRIREREEEFDLATIGIGGCKYMLDIIKNDPNVLLSSNLN